MQEFEENIVTLQELLKRNDRHFVTCAYRALLGREPDLEGFTYYIERLRAGFSKMEVIKQLRTSNEGLAQINIFPELDRKIAQHKRGQIPVLGCIFRLLESTDSNKKRDRLFRAVQNQWHISNEEAKSSHIRMEDQNTDVKQILTYLNKLKPKDTLRQHRIEVIEISELENFIADLKERSNNNLFSSEEILINLHQLLERQSELLLNRSLERDKAIAFRQKQFVNHLSALVDSNEHRFSQIEIAISQGRHLTAEKIKAIVAEPDNEQLLSQIPKLAHAVKPPIAEDIQGLSTNAAANYDQLTAAAAAYAKRAA